MPTISISTVILNLEQCAGTPLIIYNIRLTSLLMLRTKPQCGKPTAVVVPTWCVSGDWRCHAGCNHSLVHREEGDGWVGVWMCGCVFQELVGDLVVVAAGCNKSKWGQFFFNKGLSVWTQSNTTPWMCFTTYGFNTFFYIFRGVFQLVMCTSTNHCSWITLLMKHRGVLCLFYWF